MNESLSLVRNQYPDGGRAVTIALTGQKSNRRAVGAKVRLATNKRQLLQKVRSGSTFLSQSDLRLHFGLGSAQEAEAVEVQSPGGAVERLGKLRAGQIVTIAEGKGVTASTPYRKR